MEMRKCPICKSFDVRIVHHYYNKICIKLLKSIDAEFVVMNGIIRGNKNVEKK